MPLTGLRENFRSNFPDGLTPLSEARLEAHPARRRRGRGVVGRVVPGERPAVVRAARRRPSRRRRRRGRSPTAPTDAATDYPSVTRRGRRRARDDPDRLGRDRRDHLVHEHLEPDGHGRRRRSSPGTRSRAACASRRPSRPRSRPGSKAVTVYLEKAGLMEPLETLGFALAGYGCTTCIGNSGPARRADRAGDRGATSWSPRRSCRATATSRAGSIPSRARATSPRRRSSSRSRSRAGSTST